MRGLIKLRDVGLPVLGIRRVYVRSGILWAFAIVQHAHDILRNIHTDGTAEGMILEGDIALRVHIRDITIVIRCVTDITTAAIAGNILHDVRVCRVKLIGFLHRHRRGLHIHRHLRQWRHGKVDFITG